MQISDLRVLIMGCGSIGKRHARVLYDLGVKNMAAYDPSPAARAAFSELYPGCAMYEEEKEALGTVLFGHRGSPFGVMSLQPMSCRPPNCLPAAPAALKTCGRALQVRIGADLLPLNFPRRILSKTMSKIVKGEGNRAGLHAKIAEPPPIFCKDSEKRG